MHNFIEWLAVKKVREAYLSRMPAFVLSKDLNYILWVNGSGAMFFGSPLIMDFIGTPSRFDLATRNQIIAGQNTTRPIQLRGIKGRCNFNVSEITLEEQTAWLVTSLHDPLNRYERLPLIEGLNIDNIQSAIVDIDGEAMLASDGYELPAKHLKPEISLLAIGQNVQSVVDDNGIQYQYGAVKLDDVYFLVIENKEKAISNIEIPTRSDKNLNDEERLAFREIADRLKQDMNNQTAEQNTLSFIPVLQKTDGLDSYNQKEKIGEWPHENDGTARKLLHSSLRFKTSLKDLENLLDLTTDGVIFLTPDLKIQSLTHAAQGLLHRNDEKKVIGELFTTCLTHESIGHFIAYRADVDRHAFLNKGCEIEFSFDGKKQKASITLIRLETGDYAVLLYENGRKQKQPQQYEREEATKLAYLKQADITQEPIEQSVDDRAVSFLKSSERLEATEKHEALQNQEKIRETEQDWSFLARVAHEIRTPLNAMIGFAELMQGEKFGPIHNQRYREYVRDIAQSGHYILSLVNDLLTRVKENEIGETPLPVASTEYVPSALILVPVDLGVITRDAVNLMHEQANRDGIMLRISFETRLPKILADARTTKQIILNILSNAIRFTPKGGQIILSAYRERNKVVLKIKDTGIGMDRYEIERAMQPFEQIHPDHVRHNDATFVGTGLGLPLTKALVEENNGHFRIISEHGEGTIVEIQFQQS